MTKLEHFISEGGFAGALVIGDVHADLDALRKSVAYATANNLILVPLGDLVDRGTSPYETVELIHQLLAAGRAAFVVGNHDDKFRRYAEGNRVVFSEDALATIDSVGQTRMNDFLTMYTDVTTGPRSAISHCLGNTILAHASYHSDMDQSPDGGIGKKCRYRALFGEVNGERHANGTPVRLYSWIDDIPPLKTVVVGHDRSPVYNEPIAEPLVINSRFGGRAVFLDTGCGKGGHLSAAVLLADNGFQISNFMDFK